MGEGEGKGEGGEYLEGEVGVVLGEADDGHEVGGARADAEHEAVAQSERERDEDEVVEKQSPSEAVPEGALLPLEEQEAEQLRVGDVPGEVRHGVPEGAARGAEHAPGQQTQVEDEERAYNAVEQILVGLGHQEQVHVVDKRGVQEALQTVATLFDAVRLVQPLEAGVGEAAAQHPRGRLHRGGGAAGLRAAAVLGVAAPAARYAAHAPPSPPGLPRLLLIYFTFTNALPPIRPTNPSETPPA